jgi:tricorn protease
VVTYVTVKFVLSAKFICQMRSIYLSFLGLFFVVAASAQTTEAYFLSQPALSPDGKTVVFSFEGDIWKADLANGQASRLTAMQGNETNARISPDGQQVAFTGRQYGNGDLYVVPISGGEVRQLTFHSATDEMNSWSWDGTMIYFSSNRMGQLSGFKVPVKGGTPQRVLGQYFFQFDHNLFEHPTSGELFFNDTWESSNQVQRKGYRGPFNPDIQSYNLKTKQYKRYTDWQGKDFGATLDRNGNLYFISDEGNGEYNLYTLDKGKKKALTKFPTSIKTPFVNANGGKIVFEKDYQLWLYDVATDKAERLKIRLFRNSILPKEKDFDIKGNITNFDVSPDGKKIAMVSRGELFVSDAEGKFVQQINRGSVERVREVKWMADNKTILFSQTLNGFTNWYTIAADGSAGLQQRSKDLQNNRNLVLNKKRTKGVYLSGRNEVRLIDLTTMDSKTIAREELWGFQNSDPGFSPDDEYVYFTAYRHFEQDIFVHQLKTGKTTNLTESGVTETDALWSGDGRYLYFTTQRLKPSYPFGMNNAKVCRIALEKWDEPFRANKYDELFKDEKKDTAKKSAVAVTIDMNGLMDRLETVSPSLGAQFLSWVGQKGEKTTVLYSSNHGEGRNALWKTVYEPFESPKTEKIAGTENNGGFTVVESGDKVFLLAGGTLHKLNIDGSKADPIAMGYTFRRNLEAEFAQMFTEAWAQMNENYYDANFHGANWPAIKTYYQQFIPHLNSRADLRVMLNDMLGELNSSHQGFGTFGDDETIALSNRTMETGLLFEEQQPYTVKRIVARSAADKKGIAILPGDVLVKVNDEAINPALDRNYYFSKPSIDKELKLTFQRAGNMIDVKLHPQSSLFNQLYDEWVDNNQQRVDQKSNGRIAYGYMKNMGTSELDQFIIDMTKELNRKSALILDLRYNTGGNVHDEVLNFLSRRTYLQWKYREGQLTPQSVFSPSDKPIVLLINEQSLSDAEMTAQGFKALKLGTIIGNSTYRWIIFTSGVGLVDGSSVRMPAWGCYSLEGGNLEKTGVDPDIRIVNSLEDKLSGRDPQLDKAIELLLQKIK